MSMSSSEVYLLLLPLTVIKHSDSFFLKEIPLSIPCCSRRECIERHLSRKLFLSAIKYYSFILESSFLRCSDLSLPIIFRTYSETFIEQRLAMLSRYDFVSSFTRTLITQSFLSSLVLAIQHHQSS